MTNAARLQEKQMELDYRVALRQQDDAMDLEMQGRAKLWEIEKMELRSRGDFTREEQKRQRALDQYEAAMDYIDESDLFDEGQKEGLKFKATLKLLNQNIAGVDKLLFPTEPTQRQVTPTQRMSAMKRLREEVFQEPTWLQAWLPGGKGELSEDVLKEKAFLESIAAGQYTPPTGTISSGLPEVKNDADFDALPSGTEFIGPDGIKRRKP